MTTAILVVALLSFVLEAIYIHGLRNEQKLLLARIEQLEVGLDTCMTTLTKVDFRFYEIAMANNLYLSRDDKESREVIDRTIETKLTQE